MARTFARFPENLENMDHANISLAVAARALPKDILLFEILPHFNPLKLSDLREVLSLREVFVDTDRGKKRLITDDDLKDCYFRGACGYRMFEIPLKSSPYIVSVQTMKKKVRRAQLRVERSFPPLLGDFRGRVYPPCKVDVDTLETEDDILRAYPELTYTPGKVYETAVGGAHVLRLVETGEVETGEVCAGRGIIEEYLDWACRAGLDASVIRVLAGKIKKVLKKVYYIGTTTWSACLAAGNGHIDVVDLLASEFGASEFGIGAPVGDPRHYVQGRCLVFAVIAGQDAMIDHLVTVYGVDLNEMFEQWYMTCTNIFAHQIRNRVDRNWSALHYAAWWGRNHTVQHLVEKHNVDIHKRDDYNNTALDVAEFTLGYTGENPDTYHWRNIISYLRDIGATNGEPLIPWWNEDDSSYSDDGTYDGTYDGTDDGTDNGTDDGTDNTMH